MRAPLWPAASKRARPRSTASAAAIAWETVKTTVMLATTPRAVASSTAWRPAAVHGNLTWMLGARVLKWTAWSAMRTGSR